MVDISIIPQTEFERVRRADLDPHIRLHILADMCRANTLAAVKRAGSGHLGSSLSAMDLVVYLYEEVLNTLAVGLTNPARDIYFSSKGHDVPGLYSVLYSLGVITKEKFLKLRRFGGLDGHPDIGIPGVEANSGSLGMGIAKGKGMALAKRILGCGGQVFVMTGDGELQEGQIFESLQTGHHQRVGNLTVIVDHNKVQSDKPVAEIIDLGDLLDKFRAFGWCVARCEGNNTRRIEHVFEKFRAVTDRPKILIADTIKGRGVSFMEHPAALRTGGGLYPWHAGAPNDAAFVQAHEEVISRVNDLLASHDVVPVTLQPVPAEENRPRTVMLLGEPVSQAAEDRIRAGVSDESVSKAFGEALLEQAAIRPDLVVLDADLASDCKVRTIENNYPNRFIENGIAEQDMVSTAGGLARLGLLPVVNSFAAFLASRANEQIYNNASEGTKIIYALHYAGMIPAGPGKSHQSIRDISLLGALPNMTIIQPCNAEETRQTVDYCVNRATENCAIRLVIGPSPRIIPLPAGYRLEPGKGAALTSGADAVIFAYGPVMLHEALLASEILGERGFGLSVVNMPWLNRVDASWLRDTVSAFRTIYVLEDHAPVGGLGDCLLDTFCGTGLIQGRSFTKLAVCGYPACGTPQEALRFHRLDGESLANRILGAGR